MAPWQPARVKVQIRLSIQRLRTSQEKALALAKLSRREIADLLGKGRVETARLRVEGLIQGEIQGELMEVLELYSETLQARFQLLESSTSEPDPAIADAVNSIVYAAPRTDIKELNVLREMIMHKYGRTWSLTLLPPTDPADPPPPAVPLRVLSKLRLFTPSAELVDAYLYEIAKGYKVDWKPEPPAETDPLPVDDEHAEGGEGGSGGSEARKGGKGDGEGGEGGAKEGAKGKEGNDAEQKNGASETTAAQGGDTAGKSAAASTTPAPVASGGKKKTEEELLAERFDRLKNLR